MNYIKLTKKRIRRRRTKSRQGKVGEDEAKILGADAKEGGGREEVRDKKKI